MILQIVGVGNVIIGIIRTLEEDDETDNGKFNLWYQWRNSEVSVTAWRILKNERYKHYSY